MCLGSYIQIRKIEIRVAQNVARSGLVLKIPLDQFETISGVFQWAVKCQKNVFFAIFLGGPMLDRQFLLDWRGFRAQPPGKPVRMRIKMAAEVQTFVKEYVNFLTSL